MKLNKFILFIVFIHTSICLSQSAIQKQWVDIESPQKDFSISLPDDFIVDKDDQSCRINAFQNDVSIHISFPKSSKNPKNDFKKMFSKLTKEEKPKYRFFDSEDFVVAEKIENENSSKDPNQDEADTLTLTPASSKGLYTIRIKNKSLENDFLLRFLSSIKLDGNQLYNSKTPAVTGNEMISLASLKTSPLVLEALKRKESLQKKLLVASETEKKNPIEIKGYSRPLLVLRKRRPEYADTARSLQIEGTVILLVTFLASGQTGNIKLVSTPGGDLEDTAFEAAKNIKFLPAEKDGKPVDVTRFVNYNFTLY